MQLRPDKEAIDRDWLGKKSAGGEGCPDRQVIISARLLSPERRCSDGDGSGGEDQ